MLTSRLLLVVFVCGFCGCDSDNPASDATTTQPDDRLLGGYWYEVDDGDAVNGAVQVEPVEGEPGKYLLVGWNAQGIVRDEETTECITTQIDGEFYFSGRVVKPNDSSEGWGLYKYRFTSPDRFEVRSISRDRVAAAIQAGRIRGTVHHGRGLFGGSCENLESPLRPRSCADSWRRKELICSTTVRPGSRSDGRNHLRRFRQSRNKSSRPNTSSPPPPSSPCSIS